MSNMHIEVTIRVWEKRDYNSTDVAEAKVTDMAPWDEIKPTAIRRALDSVVEDAVERIERQFTVESAKRRAAEIDVEAAL